MSRFLLAAAVVLGISVSAAQAACPARVGVAYGDTLQSIAAACGVNVEALKDMNPGLRADTLRAGAFINIPRPVVRVTPPVIGRPSIQPFPSLVNPSLGGDGHSTVILPPEQPPVPQQHILRGFGNQPGQLPLPPGHSNPFNNFPHQAN